MTPTQLATDLGIFLKQVHANYFSDDAQVKGSPLIVVPGFLKMKESFNEDQYPHLVIRINKVEDTLQGSTVQLFLIHGVSSETWKKDGWKLPTFWKQQGKLYWPIPLLLSDTV